MRKLIYVVSIIFLFGNFACGKVLTREVTIYNDIDTTILFSCIGDVTHIYDNSPNPSRCFTSQMHKIEPSGTTLCTVELDFYTEDIYVYIYKYMFKNVHSRYLIIISHLHTKPTRL